MRTAVLALALPALVEVRAVPFFLEAVVLISLGSARNAKDGGITLRLGGRVLVPSEDSPMNTVVQQRIDSLLRSRTQN
jgi:hypothetical protein